VKIWVGRVVQHQVIDQLLLMHRSLALLENVEFVLTRGRRPVERSLLQNFISLDDIERLLSTIVWALRFRARPHQMMYGLIEAVDLRRVRLIVVLFSFLVVISLFACLEIVIALHHLNIW